MPGSWLDLHGAVTHFPIALLITAVIYEIGAVALRRPLWRVVSFWLLVMGVVTAVPSLIAGWMAGREVFGGLAQPPSIFVWHRAAAFTGSGLALLLLIWRAAARDRMVKGALAGTTALALAAAGVIGYTGFLGGEMVLGGSSHGAPARGGGAAHGAGRQAMPSNLAPGRQTYQQSCAGCHGANGEGKVGPALAGAGLDQGQIKNTVTKGVPPRMPAFAGQLSSAQIDAVAAYVHWLAAH